MHKYLWGKTWKSFEYVPRSDVAEPYGIFIFLENHTDFSGYISLYCHHH